MNQQKSDEYKKRFGGIARLYGEHGLASLKISHICIIGIGGIGSWAAESLARSGVGAITLVDLDDICITNTNRQIHATMDAIGKMKVQILKERILSINPDCEVSAIEEFFSNSTAASILETQYDYVIDAIDSLDSKCLLASLCREKNIPLITTGGAAGKRDPLQIQILDLGKSFNDSLLFQMRKKLRQEYNFEKPTGHSLSKRRDFNLMSVFSPEEEIPAIQSECEFLETTIKRNCDWGMGSTTHVTATFGFVAAGYVINQLTTEKK
jgi:tRNA A37 threonylcarbamoyladenosine dehydratase